ncbi:MAG: hypothetical protein Q8Q02_03865 [Nocardioides sp.]|nr:hypothetical protein [Nocardioides sp.]
MRLSASVASVVVVPAAPLLLPEHAGRADVVPGLRAAVRRALEGLHDVAVLAEPAWGEPVAAHLLRDIGLLEAPLGEAGALLVAGDGSARRGEKAPGHLDERAAPYDAVVEEALREGDAVTLASLDLDLGAELLAAGAPVLRALGDAVLASGRAVQTADLAYADDPFGVRYWVARWDLA